MCQAPCSAFRGNKHQRHVIYWRQLNHTSSLKVDIISTLQRMQRLSRGGRVATYECVRQVGKPPGMELWLNTSSQASQTR